MNRPPLGVVLRWIAAGLSGTGGIALLARVLANETNWVAIFGKSLFGISALIVGVLLVSPEFVRWALTPIMHLLDSVLLPSEKSVPPADLKLARFYGRALRYTEAAEEYARVLRYHPGHAEACLEGIRAAGLAGDDRLAKKFYLAARRHLRTREQRLLLEDMYTARHMPLGHEEATGPEALPDGP